MLADSFPASGQFIRMQLCPRSYEASSPSRKVAAQQLSVKSEARPLSRIQGVEVRRIVIAEIHRDRDPIERQDSRQTSNIRGACDTARTGHHNPTEVAPHLRGGVQRTDQDLNIASAKATIDAAWARSVLFRPIAIPSNAVRLSEMLHHFVRSFQPLGVLGHSPMRARYRPCPVPLGQH